MNKILPIYENDYIYSNEYFIIDQIYNDKILEYKISNIFGTDNNIGILKENNINEYKSIYLNEGVIDSIKEFVIRIAKKCIEIINKFFTKTKKLNDINKSWLDKNSKIILSSKNIIGKTIDIPYYEYPNIINILKSTLVNKCNTNVLESKANIWKDEDGYILDNNTINIQGFKYNTSSKDNIQIQIENHLRGTYHENMLSDNLNVTIRKDMYIYCNSIFKSLDTIINMEKEVLKNVAKDLDIYLANISLHNNSKAIGNNTNTTNNTINDTTNTNASYYYDDTNWTDFFNEDKINTKIDTTNSITNNKNDIINISKAIKTYYNINTKLISAKMNISMEVYKQYMKYLKWYISNYNTNTSTNMNNVSMADSFN